MCIHMYIIIYTMEKARTEVCNWWWLQQKLWRVMNVFHETQILYCLRITKVSTTCSTFQNRWLGMGAHAPLKARDLSGIFWDFLSKHQPWMEIVRAVGVMAMCPLVLWLTWRKSQLLNRFMIVHRICFHGPSSTVTWYPLVNKHSELENGPVEIVDFPIENGGSFYSYVSHYQRVIHHISYYNPIIIPLNHQ